MGQEVEETGNTTKRETTSAIATAAESKNAIMQTACAEDTEI